MRRIAEIEKSNEWPDEVLQLCARDSFYFIPFRTYIILEGHGKVQSSSVPYIHHAWFLPLIMAYVCWKRLQGLTTRVSFTCSGHVFCCSSASAYRTEALFELLNYFRTKQEQTTMLTVSNAEDKFCSEYETDSVSLLSFKQSFMTVSPLRVARSLPYLWNISSEMARLLDVTSLRYRIIAFNFLVVEYIKYRGLDNTTDGVESFHTFAPMPYQLKAVDHEKIYAYQHGIESDDGNRAMAIPQYAPIAYVVWGDLWTEIFKKKAHPESLIYPVGSPRYDNLVDKRRTEQREIDVLFVSASHVLDRDDIDEEAYRELVEMVVETCAEFGLELVIKLHPLEGPERYEQWGYAEYITEEESIETLLLQSDVAVTDFSSAFVESISLGTPMVVTQSSKQMKFMSLSSVNGLTFPDSLTAACRDIKRLKGTEVSIEDVSNSGFIHINNSCEKIHRIVTENTAAG